MTRTCPFSPPEVYADLRARCSWSKVKVLDGREVWFATDYASVREVLADNRFSADRSREGFPFINQAQIELIKSSQSMVTTDEPEHSLIRRRATPAFTARQVEAQRVNVERLVDGLIDSMLERGGPLDLVTEFSLVIPSTIIAGILGVPAEDHPHFHELTGRIFSLNNSPAEVEAGRLGLEDYIRGLVIEKIQDPQDDLISQYVEKYYHTHELTIAEIVTQIRTLLVAGHETTANMLSLGSAFLMEHREYREQFVAGDTKLVAGAVEEMLRYLTIMHRGLIRVALEDVMVGEQLVRKGEGVLCALNSSNRDASVFDDPDTLHFEAPNRNHVAFGFGIHQCVGQGLARLELQIGYTRLFQRIPNIHLAVPLSQLRFKSDTTVYGIHELPVTW